jgi:four helix bundle protein
MRVFEKNIEYGNPIRDKSFKFGVRIIKFYIVHVKNEYHLNDILKQLLKSGTSIGANVAESQEATS